MIIHIKYVNPALTRGLTAHECAGPQFVEVHWQVPTLPSPKSGPGCMTERVKTLRENRVMLEIL